MNIFRLNNALLYNIEIFYTLLVNKKIENISEVEFKNTLIIIYLQVKYKIYISTIDEIEVNKVIILGPYKTGRDEAKELAM